MDYKKDSLGGIDFEPEYKRRRKEADRRETILDILSTIFVGAVLAGILVFNVCGCGTDNAKPFGGNEDGLSTAGDGGNEHGGDTQGLRRGSSDAGLDEGADDGQTIDGREADGNGTELSTGDSGPTVDGVSVPDATPQGDSATCLRVDTSGLCCPDWWTKEMCDGR